MSGLLQDLRYFVRQTRRRPVWTLTIVGVLALGISANSAMYAAFDAWVLRPLPFEAEEELLLVSETQPKLGVRRSVSGAALLDVRREARTIERAEAWDSEFFSTSESVEPARITGARVTHGLFPMLGIEPILGRQFSTEEDLPAQPSPVALVGHRLWTERFDSDPEIVGKTVRVDGRVHEIVGVMPAGFRFPSWSDLWVPLGLDPRAPRDERTLEVAVRLSESSTLSDARQELEALGDELAGLYPATNEGYGLTALPLRDYWVPRVIEVALGASMAAALFVLLIVCANVASLMLARASSRAREIALRTALGAGRWRLRRQTLLESLFLAVLASVFGILLSEWWLHGMYSAAPVEPPYLFTMELNPRVALFTVVVALLAGLVSAFAPIARSSRLRVQEELRSAGRSISNSGGGSLRGVLVVLELALSTALAIGALLMVKSFLEQQAIDPGYEREGIVTLELSLTNPELAEASARAQFLERLHDELASTAAIDSLGFVSSLPCRAFLGRTLEAENRPSRAEERTRAAIVSFTGRYLETLDIPIQEGRTFTDGEVRDGSNVVLISESLARRFWPAQSALGQHLRSFDAEGSPWLRVVGVVRNVEASRDMVAQDIPEHQYYRPYAAAPPTTVTLVASSRAPLSEVAEVVRGAIRASGSSVPIGEVLTMRQAILRVQWVTRFFSEQLAVYGLIALVIAAVGLYGLVADSVSLRSQEIAIRLAVGASKQDILRGVLSKALRLAAVGALAGSALGVGGARLGSSMLLGVNPFEPVVLATVAVLLAVVSLLASYFPARRAASMDPARTLQSQ